MQDALKYCIEIKKGLIAVVCQTNIIILGKKNNIYKLVKTINKNMNNGNYDLQIKNNEFFILFSSYNNYTTEYFVVFFDIETLISIKKVKIQGNSPNIRLLNDGKIFTINDYLLFGINDYYSEKIILLSIKTKEIVQYFQIELNSLIFVKNAQIIQVYQMSQNGFVMTNLKIEEGLLDYFDEKESKIIQKDESSTKIKCFGTGTIQEIYYMDDNEALYDLGSFHSQRFGILNNA